MTTSQHDNELSGPDARELMRTFLVEVVQNGKLELIDQIAHKDIVDEANQAFGGPPGREGLRKHVVGFRRYIEDRSISIVRIVGDGNEVMAWWTFSGVHAGPWLGRSPTGETVSGTVFSFFELASRRVRRYRLWLCADLKGLVVFNPSGPPE